MFVEQLTRKKYHVISHDEPVSKIYSRIRKHSFLVVLEDNDFFGIVTVKDIVNCQDKLVCECLTSLPTITFNCDIERLASLFRNEGYIALPVFNEDTFFGVITVEDIFDYYLTCHRAKLESDVKIYSEKLQKEKKLVEQAKRIKTEFLANMSHEIRTPMNAILGMNRLALDTNLTSKQRRYLSVVQQSSETLLGLVNNLLDYSKLEAGDLRLELGSFSIASLTKKVLDKYKQQAVGKNILLKHNITSRVPETIKLDEFRMGQILDNLMSNAIKFTEKGEICVDVDFIKNDKGQYQLHVTVKDTGIGIPVEYQSKIFEIFSQLDGSLTRLKSGTGLGLALCSKLINIMDGTIGVESEIGNGSRFSVSLPVKQFRSTLHKPIADTCTGNRLNEKSNYRVLLVDQNMFNRHLNTLIIENRGGEVISVSSAQEGISAMNQKQIDIVLLDDNILGGDCKSVKKIARLAALNGVVAEELHKQKGGGAKSVPIIAMVSDDKMQDFSNDTDSVIDSYISKPLQVDNLFSILEKHT